MSWGIVAGVAGSVVGGAIAAGGAEDAAAIQAGAADRASQQQREMFDITRADFAPYRNAGYGSLNMLASYLGLPSPGWANTSGSGSPTGETEAQIRARLTPQFTTITQPTYEGMGGWDVGEGRTQVPGTTSVNQAGLDAAVQAALAEQTNNNQMAQAASFGASDPRYGSLLKPFTGADLETEPGYVFGRNQGIQSLDRSAGAAGNRYSGAQMKAALRFGNDYAGTKFGEAFNRDSVTKNRIFNMLSGVAGTGQNATSQVATAGQNMTNQVGNNMMQAANAQGASQIAGANAWQTAINGVTSTIKNRGWSPNIDTSNANLNWYMLE